MPDPATPSEVAAVPTREAQRVRDQHTATLAASDRKDSYAEQMMARNSDIPADFLDGIDNTIFQESDGRDPNARRIRNGERPDWERDFRKALEED